MNVICTRQMLLSHLKPAISWRNEWRFHGRDPQETQTAVFTWNGQNSLILVFALPAAKPSISEAPLQHCLSSLFVSITPNDKHEKEPMFKLSKPGYPRQHCAKSKWGHVVSARKHSRLDDNCSVKMPCLPDINQRHYRRLCMGAGYPMF